MTATAIASNGRISMNQPQVSGELTQDQLVPVDEVTTCNEYQGESDQGIGPGDLLREALLRTDDPAALLSRRTVERGMDAGELKGMVARPVSYCKRHFLNAVKQVVEDHRECWPLSAEQIHYLLLRDPPVTSEPQKSKFPSEKFRYGNDRNNFKSLTRLLTQAQESNELPAGCIPDSSCVSIINRGAAGLDEFVTGEFDRFLSGYRLNRQVDQPDHIEVLCQSRSLLGTVEPVCDEYDVPLTPCSGYATSPARNGIAKRFQMSGKEKLILLVVSDLDPNGLAFCEESVTKLKEVLNVEAHCHRVAVTQNQVDRLRLQPNFRKVNLTSASYLSFRERTGSNGTWKAAAVPPADVQNELRSAIEDHMDMALFENAIHEEMVDAVKLAGMRMKLARELGRPCSFHVRGRDDVGDVIGSQVTETPT